MLSHLFNKFCTWRTRRAVRELIRPFLVARDRQGWERSCKRPVITDEGVVAALDAATAELSREANPSDSSP